MYSPEAISRDISSTLMYSTNSDGFKHDLTDGGLFKSKEILGSSSDLSQNQQQGGGGLMRYRSAPSSYFASYLDGNGGNNNNSNSNSNGDSSESESMFSALMNSHDPSSANFKNHGGFGVSGGGKMEISKVESTPPLHNQNGNGFGNGDGGMGGQIGYLAAVSAGGGTVVGTYNLSVGAVGNQVQLRNCSNLVRQSSSPAGFFSGFDMMQEVGNLGGTNGAASSSTSGLNFTSGQSSKSRFMPSIAENGNQSLETGSLEDGQFGTDDNDGRHYASHFSHESWDDMPVSNLKRNGDGDLKMFSNFGGFENQGMEPRNHSSGLTHHLSLPKTAVEMATVEKYLQFQQDTVPCKVRAKRGCATHPRSIAERMRRTRISERMKKLQDLFPNMDKQANTADMLDLAVEHIKNLQKQVQTLKETRAKCTCSGKKRETSCPSA